MSQTRAVERSQLRWFRYLVRMPSGCFPGEVFQLPGMSHWRPGTEDPGHAGRIISLDWPGNTSVTRFWIREGIYLDQINTTHLLNMLHNCSSFYVL